jgi:hypothetical protein
VALLRLIRSMDAVSVNGGRSNGRQITVPDLIGVFGKRDSLEFTFTSLIEQAQLDLVALAEKGAKFVPLPSHVAPQGCGRPS